MTWRLLFTFCKQKTVCFDKLGQIVMQKKGFEQFLTGPLSLVCLFYLRLTEVTLCSKMPDPVKFTNSNLLLNTVSIIMLQHY